MNKKAKQGFTLLEILISVGVLATVSILIAQVLFTTTHVNTKSVIVQDIKQNGEFAIDVIARHIRAARSLNRTCDVGQLTTDSVEIETYQGETIQFSCQSDGIAARIASESGSGTITYLTNNNITLSATNSTSCDDSTLTFSCPETAAVTEPVVIQFTLSQRSDTTANFEKAQSTFHTSVNLRGQ